MKEWINSYFKLSLDLTWKKKKKKKKNKRTKENKRKKERKKEMKRQGILQRVRAGIGLRFFCRYLQKWRDIANKKWFSIFKWTIILKSVFYLPELAKRFIFTTVWALNSRTRNTEFAPLNFLSYRILSVSFTLTLTFTNNEEAQTRPVEFTPDISLENS